MNFIADILALAICTGIAFLYYKKGFFISLVNLGVFLAALYVTRFLCIILQAPIAILLAGKIPAEIPPVVHTTLSAFGSTLPMVMAYLILLLVSFGIFAALFLPLAKLANLLLKLPVLKQINRFLGLILGIFIGALAAYYSLSLIWPVIQSVFFANTLAQETGDSLVLPYIQQMISAILKAIKVFPIRN